MAINNPPLAGDLVDVSTISGLSLTVDTTPVDLSTDSYFSLGSLNVSYLGKTLSFSEIATPDIGSPSFAFDADVQLQIDFGSGMTTYFTGKIRKRRPTGRNNNDAIEYVAYGIQQLANEVTARSFGNLPMFHWGTGVTGTSTIASHGVYGESVQNALTDIFTYCSSDLGAAGIPTALGSPGPAQCVAAIHSELTITNAGFVDACNQILQNEPNRKLFFDDVQQKWVMPDVLSVPVETVAVNSVNINELSYEMDLTGRYTAITLVTFTSGTFPATAKGKAQCAPFWDAGAADDWKEQEGAGVDDPQNFGAGKWWVWRRWRIPDIVDERHPQAPVAVYAEFDFGGQSKFVPIDAQIDWEQRLIVTEAPVVVKGNPFHAGVGKATGPNSVWITWWKLSGAPTGGWPSLRYPAAGYEGTAYDLFGVERMKYEHIDNMGFTEENARAKLALLKDVVVSGTISLEGDPIAELINLQKRVCVTHDVKSTGIESISAVFLEYSYTFGGRGKSDIRLTTDMSGLVRVHG